MMFLEYNGWLWKRHRAGRSFANLPCLNGVFTSKDPSFKTCTDGSISIAHVRNDIGIGKHGIVIWGMLWGVWLYNHEHGLSQWILQWTCKVLFIIRDSPYHIDGKGILQEVRSPPLWIRMSMKCWIPVAIKDGNAIKLSDAFAGNLARLLCSLLIFMELVDPSSCIFGTIVGICDSETSVHKQSC